MGQQQLLLIVLVIVVVGLAVSSGLRIMGAFSQSHDRDIVIQQLNVLSALAKKHAAQPRSMGGGEGGFIGFTPPSRFTSNEHLRIYITTGEDWVLFQGFGTVEGWDGASPVQVVAQFDRTANGWTTMMAVN